MKHIFNIVCASLILLSFSTKSIAQTNQQTNRPSFTITPLNSNPIIDGDVINETLWQTINPVNQLTQIKPNFGQPASEKTEIRMAITKNMLYVAVVCYDSSPKTIVVSDSRRDADLSNDDSFLFIVDTYSDKQNGFMFGTNSNGMEYDAQIDNEGQGNFNSNRQQGGVIGGTNINWDASWEVKAQTGDYGWSADMLLGTLRQSIVFMR